MSSYIYGSEIGQFLTSVISLLARCFTFTRIMLGLSCLHFLHINIFADSDSSYMYFNFFVCNVHYPIFIQDWSGKWIKRGDFTYLLFSS